MSQAASPQASQSARERQRRMARHRQCVPSGDADWADEAEMQDRTSSRAVSCNEAVPASS
jgi:hypothetical protein